jgi:hypothetical protein
MFVVAGRAGIMRSIASPSVLSDGTDDPDEQARDVLLVRIFPRRAQIIDTATLRGLASP